jgi:hypothetical protein
MKVTYSGGSLLFLAVLLAGGCASPVGTSLPGRTSASPQLENDTLLTVMGMDRAEDGCCNQRKVTNREVIANDSQKALEHWTVDRCGTLVRYTITYTRSPSGGTFIGVSPGAVVGKAQAREAITLPKEFGNVWYRSGDKGFSLKAYSASGKLVISETRLIFREKDEVLEIEIREIKSVSLGKMAGDTFNDWATIRYGGSEKIAGFKDGSNLGWGTDTNLICSALKYAFEKKSAQPRQ